MAKEAEALAAQGRRITELREREKLTQPEVADALRVSLRGYQAWEAGDSDPRAANLKALAAFYKVSTEYIEYGPEGPPERGAPPDLFGSLSGGTVAGQLARIEKALAALQADHAQLLALFTREPSAAATLADAVSGAIEQALDRRAREAGLRGRQPPPRPPAAGEDEQHAA